MPKMGLFRDILRDTFFQSKKKLYNLHRNDTFESQVDSIYHGIESLFFLSPKILDLVPLELNQSESLQIENKEIHSF